MKRQLPFIHNESGFYLPVVLTITTLALSFLTMLIYVYKNDLLLTESMVHQIKAETLIQMATTEFTSNATHYHDAEGSDLYGYPYGEVKVNYVKETENKWKVNYHLELDHTDIQMERTFRITITPNDE